MISIIVPTMWRGFGIQQSLINAESHPLVGEILIINNAPDKTPDWFKTGKWSKIKHANFGRNIYVNPAWDIGIRNSVNDKISIMSDDIKFDPAVYDAVYDHIDAENGCIGCATFPESPPTGKITLKKRQRYERLFSDYANLFFFHKSNYLSSPIPKQFMILFGDTWIYDYHWSVRKNPQEITNLNIVTQNRKHGTTSASPEFYRVSEQDKQNMATIRDWPQVSKEFAVFDINR